MVDGLTPGIDIPCSQARTCSGLTPQLCSTSSRHGATSATRRRTAFSARMPRAACSKDCSSAALASPPEPRIFKARVTAPSRSLASSSCADVAVANELASGAFRIGR